MKRRWENRVVREVDRTRARWYWGLLLGMLVAAAPGALWVVCQNECLRLSYRASELRTERDLLMERERRLRVRRAALENLRDVEAWAIERRGFVRPTDEQVVMVREVVARPRGMDRGKSKPTGTR